jgi:hypothetical protein
MSVDVITTQGNGQNMDATMEKVRGGWMEKHSLASLKRIKW